MIMQIIKWQDADIDKLRALYIQFPYPPYFGSSVVDEKLQEYRFNCVKKAAVADAENIFAVVSGSKVLCAAQLKRTDHLSDHFGIEVARVTNEAFVCNSASENYKAFLMLLGKLRESAQKRGVAFVTTTAASQTHQWIRTLEDTGFRYSAGFRHVSANVDKDYSSFLKNDLVMRDLQESDFEEIAYSYEHMPFPNHLLYEPEFDKSKIISLYVRRYREVHEKLGKVFVAELQGRFAGALNGIMDRDILHGTGIAVNHLSQGLIVHPRAAGKGVALALIAYRNPWYQEQGIRVGYYGSNINNLPMIFGLEKMGTKHAGIEISMILRLKEGQQ